MRQLVRISALLFGAGLLALIVATTASGHIGAVLATAKFETPPPLMTTPADAGVVLSPYTFATSDQSIDIAWNDGDIDPTGHFFFYYLDHEPVFAVQAADIPTLGKPMHQIPTPPATSLPTGEENDPAALWAGCTCPGDLGISVVCPDAGVRDCRNDFTWDTSGIAAGTYWVVAQNMDSPLQNYSVSGGPVRIAHGGAGLPPAVKVLRPDGLGNYDKSYRVQWYAVGKAPLEIDLAYGVADHSQLGTVTPLAKNVQAIQNPDGTQSWDWDISQLPAMSTGTPYFLRVTVTDADGVSVYSDSHFALTVYHPPPMPDGGAMDLAVPGDGGNLVIHPNGGCSCEVAGGSGGPGPLALGIGLLVGIALFRRRQRA